MNQPGAADPQYIQARKILLDVLRALGAQRDALILVGAQAIYLRTSLEDTAVAEFTTDADLAINPEKLLDAPALSDVMENLGLELQDPGIWTMAESTPGGGTIEVDLIVPEAIAKKAGRRAARLHDPHGQETARKTRGIEGALVDNGPVLINSLDPADTRICDALVAGPTALLIAKLHKIGERKGNPVRLLNKDAFDIYRLLRSTPTAVFTDKIKYLKENELTRAITDEALTYLNDLFSRATSTGSRMAGAAAVPFEDPEVIANACAALAEGILRAR